MKSLRNKPQKKKNHKCCFISDVLVICNVFLKNNEVMQGILHNSL